MKKLLFFTFLCITITLNAQVSFEARIEFELKNGYENENIVEFGENGFILRSRNTSSQKGQKEWKYDLYNSDLVQDLSTSIYIDNSFYVAETWASNEREHTLFRTKKGAFLLYAIEAKTLKVTKVEGSLPKKAFVRDMAIIDDYAYFHATIKRNKLLYSINWKTGKSHIIPVDVPGYSNKKLVITHFEVFKETKEVLLYIKAYEGKASEIYIMRLNDLGEKQEVYQLTDSIDNNLVSISASSLGDNKYIFTGTYSSKYSNKSEGLFFCEATKGQVKFIEYYNFSDLENFFKYLPERKQAKLVKKKAKKEAKGKQLKINYFIAGHPIIEIDDGYAFLGEAYYPTYRTESYTTYVNGKPVTRTRTVFDGYQYTHAILAKYDKNGKMVWDQVFEMWPHYKPFYIKRFISLADGTQEGIHLVFASKDRITSKTFDFDGNVKLDRTSDEIKPKFEGDKSKWSYSNLNYWYDNYFLAYGSQKIKNKEAGKKVKRKRKVYFVSKVKYE